MGVFGGAAWGGTQSYYRTRLHSFLGILALSLLADGGRAQAKLKVKIVPQIAHTYSVQSVSLSPATVRKQCYIRRACQAGGIALDGPVRSWAWAYRLQCSVVIDLEC